MSALKQKLFAAKRMETEQQTQKTPFDEEASEWKMFDARLEQTEAGQYIRRTVMYEWETTFGDHTLGELHEQAKRLSMLSGVQQGEQVTLEQLLFLDTETTGLGVGTGNTPFMIGMAYAQPEGLVIEQTFMRTPAEEPPMLVHLQRMLRERPRIITYNGKSFDWPVIKNRFVLNRLHRTSDVPFEPLHFDFLHPARSLWRHTLSSCRLSTVESERLGMERVDDVPGSLAPTLYFQYLQQKRPELVQGVFEHNEKDLLSLAVLAIHFGKLLAGQFDPDALGAEELFRLAVWLERSGAEQLAETAYERLELRRGPNMPYYFERLAERRKKRKQWQEAIALWQQCITEAAGKSFESIVPYVELAKYYEHQTKQYEVALKYATAAREQLIKQFSLTRNQEKRGQRMAELDYRIARIERKAAAASPIVKESSDPLYAGISLFDGEIS